MTSTRAAILIALHLSALLMTMPARAQQSGTANLCPTIDFTGFSLDSGKNHVPERIWWDAKTNAYAVQGPELAMRFLFPDDAGRALSDLKADPAHVYRIPVDRPFTKQDGDYCRPKVEIAGHCQMAEVPGAASEPAFIFTADYYDACESKPARVVIRVEKLNVAGRSGIQFAFFNTFRNVYDSGMDVIEGENVFNMGYRLR